MFVFAFTYTVQICTHCWYIYLFSRLQKNESVKLFTVLILCFDVYFSKPSLSLNVTNIGFVGNKRKDQAEERNKGHYQIANKKLTFCDFKADHGQFQSIDILHK